MINTKRPLLAAYCSALSSALHYPRVTSKDVVIVAARRYDPRHVDEYQTCRDLKYQLAGGQQLLPAVLRVDFVYADAVSYVKWAQTKMSSGEELAFGLRYVRHLSTGHVEVGDLQAFDGKAGLRSEERLTVPAGWIAVPTKNSYHFYKTEFAARTVLPDEYKDQGWLDFSIKNLAYLRVTQNSKA